MFAAGAVTKTFEFHIHFFDTYPKAFTKLWESFSDKKLYPTSGVYLQDNQGGFTPVVAEGPDVFSLADKIATIFAG